MLLSIDGTLNDIANNSLQCEFILFREDVTNAAIFSELRHRIPQVTVFLLRH